MSNSSTTLDSRSDSGLRDIHRLISECHEVLQADPSCLHTRAVRGHACMKAKLWDQADRTFQRFYAVDRTMSTDASVVVWRSSKAAEIQPSDSRIHASSQHDEKENSRGFRAEKRRIGMHESAEHLIRKTMGGSTRSRRASLEPPPTSDSWSSFSGLGGVVDRPPMPVQHPSPQPTQDVRSRSELDPGKRPRKVVQVRVNLSDFSAAAPQSSIEFNPVLPQKVANPATTTHLEAPKTSCGNNQIQLQPIQAPRVLTVRAVPKTVRRVTVAL
ncbi:hypothetical protein GQ600_5753 [Phytophthora cactorum]|nr:hypothetical protein GQ600_5753 [Phytophthora cactorum]